MKKLMQLAALCLVALAVVPISSASADKFKGTCEIQGNATFKNPLPFVAPEENEYKFTSAVVPGNAAEELLKGKFAKGKEVYCEGEAEKGAVKENGPFTGRRQ
jgi:hypothetical protein